MPEAKTTITMRMGRTEREILDRLVDRVRAYHATRPPFLTQDRPTTRSSAMRDLLLAWGYDLNSLVLFAEKSALSPSRPADTHSPTPTPQFPSERP